MEITIIGSGNIAHALVACINRANVSKVNILTTNSTFKADIIEAHCNDSSEKFGTVNKVTNRAIEVIPNSDIVLLTVPAFIRKDILTEINQYLKDEAIVGAFPGIGGFDEEVISIIRNKSINYFASQRVPYIARVKDKGELVKVAKKDEIFVAIADNKKEIQNLLSNILDMRVNLLNDFLEVSLSNSNPILHSARLYRLFKSKRIYQEPIYFYEEWDSETSEILLNMDSEFMQIVKELNLKNINSLKEHYEVDTIEQMTNKIVSIGAFKDILTPMIKVENGYIADISSRYFIEDIAVGLKYIKDYATKKAIKTPTIDKVYIFLIGMMEP